MKNTVHKNRARRGIRKSARPAEVRKMMSDEEKAIVDNLASMIQELGAATAQEPAMKQEEAPADEYAENNVAEMSAKKGIETTQSDSSTASDNADARLEETIPEESEDSVKEVAKVLATALSSIGKSKTEPAKPVDPVLKAISDLTEVVKQVRNDQDANSEAIAGLMKGLGVAKSIEDQYAQVKKAQEPEDGEVQQNTLRFINNLQKALEGNGQAATVDKSVDESIGHEANANRIHKNLHGLLKGGLFSGDKPATGPRTLAD